MQETFFNIDTVDNKKIYCVYSTSQDTPSNKAVLLAHGLTGHLNEYIHFIARDYFLSKGYDVFRMAFYAEEEQYRLLTDCTLKTQANDMNSVVAHIKTKHEKVFVCGHSYGGMTILFANPDTTANAFWDSSFMPWQEFWNTKEIEPLPNSKDYQVHWVGITQILSQSMHSEAKKLTEEDSHQLAAHINAPSAVFMADHPNNKLLFEALTVPKIFSIIENADHCFTRGETALELVKQTHAWFEKF